MNRKGKIFVCILALIVCCTLGFALTACNNDTPTGLVISGDQGAAFSFDRDTLIALANGDYSSLENVKGFTAEMSGSKKKSDGIKQVVEVKIYRVNEFQLGYTSGRQYYDGELMQEINGYVFSEKSGDTYYKTTYAVSKNKIPGQLENIQNTLSTGVEKTEFRFTDSIFEMVKADLRECFIEGFSYENGEFATDGDPCVVNFDDNKLTITATSEDGELDEQKVVISNINSTQFEVPAEIRAIDKSGALAAKYVKFENCRYYLNSDGKSYSLNGFDTENTAVGEEFSVSLLSEINGLPVTRIGSRSFANKTGLTAITIPAGVTEIGYNAFEGCSALKIITIPAAVKEIGSGAFEGCSALESVTFAGNKLETIELKSFMDCVKLASIDIPSGVTKISVSAFEGCSALESVNFAGNKLETIEANAFVNCAKLASITIPSSVTFIGTGAFFGTGIIDAAPNNSAVYVGRFVVGFKGSPTTVTLRDGALICDGAFENCTSLTGITIPNSVLKIGSYTFDGCRNLINISLPGSVTSIDSYAFYGCTSLSSIVIPDSVTNIEERAFYGCTSLRSIVIPGSVKAIGSFAFYNCDALSSVTLNKGVVSIEYEAFGSCRSLTEIVIPDSVTKIGGFAFSSCSNLRNVIIPDSVKEIGYDAFYSCASNISIKCEAAAKPNGWHSDWNDGVPAGNIVWGYTGE